MESRKITIVTTTNSQTKKVIMSAATTLKELKADLTANGISYNNMDFFEGVSKTKILTDDSILPTNVPYKGEVTNELVFMLSTVNKKITSGQTPRPELYAKIKSLNLQEAIKAEFGKNFTQVATSELEAFIEANTPQAPVPTPQAENITENPANVQPCKAEKAVRKLVEILVDEDIISEEDGEEVLSILGEEATTQSEEPAPLKKEPEIESSYEEEEIDDMFENLV